MKKFILISTVLFAASSFAADGSAYKGKAMFIQQNKHISKCFPIGPRTIETLNAYDSCGDFKAENAPLQKSFAKCDKADKSVAYIFENTEDCSNAQSDIADGNAT